MVLQIFSWGLNIVNLLGQQQTKLLNALSTLLRLSAEIKHGGFGKHLPAQPDQAIFTWFKYLYVLEFMYAFAQTTNKLSM